MEVDAHHDPPASEAIGACKPVQGPRSGCLKIWYSEGEVLQSSVLDQPASRLLALLNATKPCSVVPVPRAPPSLISPPTPSAAAPRHTRLEGHFLFSAKFICMGKQKNRLTTTKTRNATHTGVPARPQTRLRASVRAGAHGSLYWTQRRRSVVWGSVGCRVARDRPTLHHSSARQVQGRPKSSLPYTSPRPTLYLCRARGVG